MRRQVLIALMLLSFGCKNRQEPHKNFLENSNVTQEKSKLKADSSYYRFNYQRFYLLLSEEGFLEGYDYDFFLIYAFANFRESHQYYIVKSFKGIVTISKKIATDDSPPFLFYSTDPTEKYKARRFTVSSKIEQLDRILPLKNLVDSALDKLHEFDGVNPDIRDFYSCLYYFNGIDYYSIDYLHLNPETMKVIDSTFQHSEIFRSM